MALYIAKKPQYRANEKAPRGLQQRYADLRPSRAENQAIQNLGRLLSVRAEEMKRERDAAVVGDMYNSWRDSERNVLNELSNKKGRDAVNLGQEYDKFYNKSQGELVKAAENGAQQRTIDQMIGRRRQQSLDGIANYEAQESKRYLAEQEKGVIDNGVADARSAGFNSVDFKDAKLEVLNFISKSNPGISQEAKEAKFRAIESQMTFANMQAQIEINPDDALKNIELNKEILGPGYDQLKNNAIVKSKDKLIQEIRDDLNFKHTKGFTIDFNAMEDDIQKSKTIDDEIKDNVIGWIRSQEREYNTRQKKVRDETQDKEMDSIFGLIRVGDYTGARKLTNDATTLTNVQRYRIENTISSSEKDTTDSADYIDIAKAAMRGETTRDAIINKIGDGISVDDAESLLIELKKAQDPARQQFNKSVTTAVDAIEKQVVKGNQWVGYNPDSVNDAYEAIKEFEKLIANPPTGVRPEQLLDPYDDNYIVNDIVKRHITPLSEQMRRQVEPYIKKNKEGRKIGETIEEYDRRVRNLK